MTKHNPEEAAEIACWADELLNGVPQAMIMSDMARRGVLTQAEKDGRKRRRNGEELTKPAEWGGRTMWQILLSPRTVGDMVYQGEVIVRDVLPPIISRQQQEALRALHTMPGRDHGPGPAPKWLVSLIMLCGICDDGETFVKSHGADAARNYRCETRGHAKTPAPEVDEHIEYAAMARLARPDLVNLLPAPVATVDFAALQAEITALEAGKAQATKSHRQFLLTGKGITLELLEEVTTQADEEIAKRHALIDQATVKSPLTPFVGATPERVRELWMSLSLGKKREILRMIMVIKAMPGPERRNAKKAPIADRVKIFPILHLVPEATPDAA
ncbi:recombinase family protein [Herbidospora sp. RD11066]